MNTKKRKGFTIVELLIVIVVIAILAAISIVAYNGIQKRALNTKRLNSIKEVAKIYEVYKATYGTYPTRGTNGSYCVGRDLAEINASSPGGECGETHASASGTYTFSESTTVNAELAKVAQLPSATTDAIHGGYHYDGFVVIESATQIVLLQAFAKGADGPADCAALGLSHNWIAGDNVWMTCRIALTR